MSALWSEAGVRSRPETDIVAGESTSHFEAGTPARNMLLLGMVSVSVVALGAALAFKARTINSYLAHGQARWLAGLYQGRAIVKGTRLTGIGAIIMGACLLWLTWSDLHRS